MPSLRLGLRLSGPGARNKGGGVAPPQGFYIIANDDGSYEVDDAGLIYIEEAA